VDKDLTYLERLTLALTYGASRLPDEITQRHADFVLSQQREDGGWAGREGESDLYYSSFALRTLAFLGLLEGDVAHRSAQFLRSKLHTFQTIVDLLALVYSVKLLEASIGLDVMSESRSDWQSRLAALLSQLRRSDGGYAKSLEGQAGSTYQTFLVLLCLQLIDQPITDPEGIRRFVLGQKQDDGGFLEIRVGKRSGVNPTAAAIGALSVIGGLDESLAQDTGEFLADMQSDGGGFQANSRIPLPDVLSTFTACVTLLDLNRLHWVDVGAAQKYVLSMSRSGGGFAGFELDPAKDVEYTFYGLGALALFQLEQAQS
jgi:geranylgeranyl transferase type-2 subunit beta